MFLPARECDHVVLGALVHVVGYGGDEDDEDLCGLVHRTGLLGTPDGGTRSDRGLADWAVMSPVSPR